MSTVTDFDITTAFEGQTVKHVASQNAYTVTRVTRPVNGHDFMVTIKSVRGAFGFVGSECDLQPHDFVVLKP